ncbi:MAG: hypothetical protein QNJ47_25945 [Nostocaceae cyanobacterium]|nr:hypothetical protein [Nostocaceae cyanobacterium]
MPVKKFCSIMAISALIFVPLEIASAGEVNVRNGGSSVIIKDGAIDVKNGSQRIYVPRRLSNYQRRWRRLNQNRFRRFGNQRGCRSSNSTYRITQRSRSGINRSYSSTQTTICSR